MYENVRWTVNYPDMKFPLRLRAFINLKFSTIDRAIEVLQVSSPTMYSYLRKGNSSRTGGVFTYPNVPFLLKLAGLGCNLHWLITGKGRMEIDVQETFMPEIYDWRRECAELLGERGITSRDKLIAALHALDTLDRFSEVIHLHSVKSGEPESRAPYLVCEPLDYVKFLAKPLPKRKNKAEFQAKMQTLADAIYAVLAKNKFVEDAYNRFCARYIKGNKAAKRESDELYFIEEYKMHIVTVIRVFLAEEVKDIYDEIMKPI